MIGKVQDVVMAAIVAGAADKVSNDTMAASNQNANESQSTLAQIDEMSANSMVQAGEESQNANQQNDKDKDSQQKMDENTVSFMTKELNELMSKMNCDLEFQYHKEVNMMSVKMLDKKTQEVLKEVPPEDMIKHMIKARDWLGAFLDKNA
ncbi:MAG: flagellar protein FlaG [Selenomonas sp.]|nr:flagellar protein FlaG [Selenomonas sp.]